MKRGWDAKRVIRPSSQRFNVFAAQWNKEAYFMIKSKTTNEDKFCEFIKFLISNSNQDLQRLYMREEWL